ncbi:MAG: hypothetical protein JSU87_14885 [Gemmatimonadota bacterium]|nr:MAG: hypothetical protein JSU87_14885 [Gemmatimonadota bacterium]
MRHTEQHRSRTTVLVLIALAAHLAGTGVSAQESAAAGRLTRQQLIQDIRELSDLLVSAHPDPYTGGGGKVAYHRRLQELIRSMPMEGLTRQQFHTQLQPFIAKLEDGHTTLPLGGNSQNRSDPGGIPLFFEVVDEVLYVSAVTSEDHLPFIGAILESVEDTPFAELVRRESQVRGHDNLQHVLSGLARYGALYFGESLRRLVPEWTSEEQIRVRLRLPSGELEDHNFKIASEVEFPLHRRPSRIELPDPDRSFTYHFLDDRRDFAFLRIDDMTTYREMFEYSRGVGSRGWERWAGRVFQRVHQEDPPDDLDDVIAGIPSATDMYRSLFNDMKAAQSRTLIVDLRRNFGGNDLMVQIFLYFMVGFDRAIPLVAETAAIQKLSPFFIESTAAGIDLGAIEHATQVPVIPGDYDFSSDPTFMSEAELDGSLRASYRRMFEQMPTFYALFSSREDEALYIPEKIVVLCGNATQSSGFDLLTNLYRLGAKVVGVRSSQAGNHFGNTRAFTLTHSKLGGYLSTKYFVAYPGESPTGFTLDPHYILTYDRLASFDFDANATLLLALELLGS